jgi:hypothetical protein
MASESDRNISRKMNETVEKTIENEMTNNKGR